MNGRDYTDIVDAQRDEMLAARLEPLAAAYAKVFRRFGHQAAENYTRLTPVLAAARPDELYHPDELVAEADLATRKLRRAAASAMIQGVLTQVGIAFDVAPLAVDALTAQIGVRAYDLNASMKDQLTRTIDKASAEGWTVPETAAEIRAGVNHMAGYTSEMLARTDLIGLSNGGSIVAAREVLDPGATKTWLTAEDDRVRPTHAEADGLTVPLDQQFQVGGEGLDYPGDPQGSDGNVCNCRCTVLFDDRPVTAAADGPDVSDLAMIAVYPTPEEQAALAVEDGQDPETIHCTMVFLGEADSFDWTAANRAVAAAARDTPAMAGRVGGAGCFAAGPDGRPMIAIPSVLGLASLRSRLVDALAAEGIASPSEHDWAPHLTITYTDEPDPSACPWPTDAIGGSLTFRQLSLVRGDTRTDYSLPEEDPMKPGATASITLKPGPIESRVPILDAQENVLGYVDVTELTDSTIGGEVDAVTAATTVVITDGDSTAEAAAVEPLGWVSDVGFEGTATGDGRWIAPGALSWREPPLTLMGLLLTGPGGHEGAEVAGRMDSFERDSALDMDGNALPEGVTAIRAYGIFDTGEFGAETGRMVDDETVRGISVDLSIEEWCFRDPATGELLVPDDMTEEQWERAFYGELQYAVLAATIMAATVCPTPAFADARIAAVRASGGEREVTLTLWAPIRVAEPVTASAAGLAPVKPPRNWFNDPQLTDLTPLTVTPEGRVFGHLAPWNACHTGRAGCVPPPRHCNYDATFHLGSVECDDGDDVSVGQITLDSGHGSLKLTPGAVIRHYDHTGTAVVDVRVGEDAHGPWVAGALRPDVSASKVRVLKAAKLSGDWRPIRGKNELLGILSVNVPGFIVPRAIAASGAPVDGEGLADHLGMPVAVDETVMRVLGARAEGGMEALAAIAEGE